MTTSPKQIIALKNKFASKMYMLPRNIPTRIMKRLTNCVNWIKLSILLVLDILIFGTILLFHKKFLAICFDEKQALLQGLKVKSLYFLLLSLVAVTVVLLIQVVGVILVIAVLTLPAAVANLFFQRFSYIMLAGCIVGMVFTFLGLWLSFSVNWPPGATIALMSTVGYFTCLSFKKGV